MNNGSSSPSAYPCSSLTLDPDPKKVKQEIVSSEDEDEVPIQQLYADVMQELGVKIKDVDDFINRLDPEERGWILDQTTKNIAEVAKVVPFARRKDMEHSTKYQQMLLAQKQKAVQQFHERNSSGARFNPVRSAKSRVAQTGYGQQGHDADEDSDIELVSDTMGSEVSKKKKKKKSKKNHSDGHY